MPYLISSSVFINFKRFCVTPMKALLEIRDVGLVLTFIGSSVGIIGTLFLFISPEFIVILSVYKLNA